MSLTARPQRFTRRDRPRPLPAPERPRESWRATYVPAPHYYNLNQACVLINKAFEGYGGFGCYLVGSSLERRDFRDVDVRFIMEDEHYERLFGRGGGHLDALWSLMCTTLSAWLSQQSELPIDFQIQKQSKANADNPGKKRNPLGLFLDYPGTRPSETESE